MNEKWKNRLLGWTALIDGWSTSVEVHNSSYRGAAFDDPYVGRRCEAEASPAAISHNRLRYARLLGQSREEPNTGLRAGGRGHGRQRRVGHQPATGGVPARVLRLRSLIVFVRAHSGRAQPR